MVDSSGDRANGNGVHELGDNGGRVPLGDRIALDSWIAEEARRWTWAQPLARNGLAPIAQQAEFARTVKTRIGDPLLEGWPGGGDAALRQVRQSLDTLFGPGGLLHSRSARGRRVLELLEPGGDEAAQRAAGALGFFAGVAAGELSGAALEGWHRAAAIDREVRQGEQRAAYETRIAGAERELAELRQRVAVGDPLAAVAEGWQRRAKQHRQRARAAMDRVLLSAGASLIGAFILLFVPGFGSLNGWFEAAPREAAVGPANGTAPRAVVVASPAPIAPPAGPRLPERAEPPDVPFYCLFDFWPFKCTPQPTPPSPQATAAPKVAPSAPPAPPPPRPVVSAPPAATAAAHQPPPPPVDPLERWGPRLAGLVVWLLFGAWLMRLFAADRRLHEALALEAEDRATLATAFRALALADPARADRHDLLGTLLRPSALPSAPSSGGLDGIVGAIRRAWRSADRP